METLISSLKPIGNIVLICCAFFIIFGILGVQVVLLLPIKQPPCLKPYCGHLYPQVQAQGTEQSGRDRQARKPSAAALFHELSLTIMSLQPLAKTAKCSENADVNGCSRQELTLAPGRSLIRVWVSVTGRTKGWHSRGLAGHIHGTLQEQAAQCLLA